LSISGAPLGAGAAVGSIGTAGPGPAADVVGQLGSAKSATPARVEAPQTFTLGKHLPSESSCLGVSREDVVDIARLAGLETFDHVFDHRRDIDPSEPPV
jgi:hypothetical protein